MQAPIPIESNGSAFPLATFENREDSKEETKRFVPSIHSSNDGQEYEGLFLLRIKTDWHVIEWRDNSKLCDTYRVRGCMN